MSEMGASVPDRVLSPAATEPSCTVSAHSGDAPSRFTYAQFVRITSRLASMLAKETEATAYGAWNPLFCAADASVRALDFFAELRREIAHWERAARAAIADRSPQGQDREDGLGAQHESAGRNGIAQTEVPHD
jgi:hypothetical protein